MRSNIYCNFVPVFSFLNSTVAVNIVYAAAACHDLGLAVDREVIGQYVAHPGVARDFANYLELYYRYKADYQVDEILSGRIREGTLNRLKFASVDERLKVTSLLLSSLTGTFRDVYEEDQKTSLVYSYLSEVKKKRQSEAGKNEKLSALCQSVLKRERKNLQSRISAGQSERELTRVQGAAIEAFEGYALLSEMTGDFAALKERFSESSDRLSADIEKASGKLEYAFDFMEAAYGEGQEMVVFITELSMNRYAAWLLEEYDCDRYYMYNKNLLFNEKEQLIREQLERVRELQVT